MATERKLRDPGEAALSAVEQALNLDPPEDKSAPAPRDADLRLPDVSDSELLRQRARPVDLDIDIDIESATLPDEFDTSEPERDAAPLLPPDRAAVANDDRQSVGLILQALQARPSRRPYLMAALASAVWIGGLLAALWSEAGGNLGAFIGTLSPLQVAGTAAAVLAPVIFFLVAAMLAVRAQEMRQVARTIGEIAVRLGEPETLSADAVFTMSQAVRREVAAMGDGVERALARAGELETLVRSEIATLERAYSNNEIRVL